MAGKVVDLWMVYQLLRRLTTPFDETQAYKLGIIDDQGKKIRDPKTREEKKAYGVFDRLVFNMKKLLGKVPGGKSRLASYAAALWLIKEQDEYGRPTIHPDNTNALYEGIMSEMKTLIENNYAQYNMLKEEIMKNEEEAPTNTVGGGQVAGAGPNDDPPGKLPLNHKKDKKAANTASRTIKSFKKFANEDLNEFRVSKPESNRTLGIPRGKMPQVRSKDMNEFFDYLKERGADIKNTRIEVGKVKFVQDEFFDDKVVNAMLRRIDVSEKEKPVLMSSDNYVIDGNHRVLAALNMSEKEKIKVVQVTNMDVDELLNMTMRFPKTQIENIPKQ